MMMAAGWALLALGAVGAIVPVLPTTPFVLLAAGCFSCSSQRLYAFLLRSRFFGPYIENYQTGQGVTLAAKIRGIVAVWALLLISMLSMGKPWMTILLIVVGLGVTAHLLLLKTKQQ